MKINFKQLNVEVEFGKFEKLDFAILMGNFIHANTIDIGLDDVAREIYHSQGEMEISNEHAAMIRAMVENKNCPLLAAVKKAVIQQLSQ